MVNHLFGSLVIHAEQPVPQIYVPEFKGVDRRIGQHVSRRYNGTWVEAHGVDAEIFLPQRYKRLAISVTDADRAPLLAASLEQLDSQYEGARQLFKLSRMLDAHTSAFAATVNISNAKWDVEESGSFYLLSREIPIYVALVFDVEEHSVQLMWSTVDFKTSIQQAGLFRHAFFPLPTLVDRPLFIHTQSLCARWWKLTSKSFRNERHGYLQAANAIELLLYKDPNVRSYGQND